MLILSSLDNGSYSGKKNVLCLPAILPKNIVSFLKIIIVLLRYTYIDAGGGNFSWHFACAFFLTAVVQALMQFIADLL